MGVDYFNQKVSSVKKEVSSKSEEISIFIQNLKENTDYSVFVIGADANPDKPTLMSQKQILKLNVKTDIAPERDFLDLGTDLMENFYLMFCLVFLI